MITKIREFRNNQIWDIVIFLLSHILLGILIQISAAYILEGVITLIPGLAETQEEYSNLVEDLTNTRSTMLLYVAILAPLIEEAIFRLGLIGLGRKKLGFWTINVISSILFGLYHQNVVQTVYAFFLGLALGVIFQYSKGYKASALVHVTINVSGIYLAPWLISLDKPVKNLLFGLLVLIPTIANVLFIVYTDPKRDVQLESVVKNDN